MDVTIKGHTIYCYTGGRDFDASQPTLVLIHGVVNDHSVWALQSRWFAHHGWNVLAIDLPGHCRSAGPAPESVQEGAEFIQSLLDALDIERAALVGHSWGSLIALEAAARLGNRISHLALIGTAYPMKVAPSLLEASKNAPESALRLVNVFSRATLSPPPGALGPGTWNFGAGLALGRKVLRSNSSVNVFHRGFVACDSYTGAIDAMSEVTCPVHFVLGAMDQMTPPKAAVLLIDAARLHCSAISVDQLSTGHNAMTEAPEATLSSLRNFLQT